LRPGSRRGSTAALVGLLACARAAAADPRPTRAHLIEHGVATGGGVLIWMLSETALKDRLAPSACSWCQPPAFDRYLRDHLRWRDPGAADTLSNVTAFVIAPGISLFGVAAVTGHRDGLYEGLDDVLAILEAGVTASLVDQGIKFAVGRERPFVRYGDPARPHQLDDDLSFFSGHTALAFAYATAGATVASRRHLRAAPWIWAGGLGFAATTGYLRIAADKHYLSDVAVGALVGTGVGVLLPRLLHDHDVTVVPAPGGIALLGTF